MNIKLQQLFQQIIFKNFWLNYIFIKKKMCRGFVSSMADEYQFLYVTTWKYFMNLFYQKKMFYLQEFVKIIKNTKFFFQNNCLLSPHVLTSTPSVENLSCTTIQDNRIIKESKLILLYSLFSYVFSRFYCFRDFIMVLFQKIKQNIMLFSIRFLFFNQYFFTPENMRHFSKIFHFLMIIIIVIFMVCALTRTHIEGIRKIFFFFVIVWIIAQILEYIEYGGKFTMCLFILYRDIYFNNFWVGYEGLGYRFFCFWNLLTYLMYLFCHAVHFEGIYEKEIKKEVDLENLTKEEREIFETYDDMEFWVKTLFAIFYLVAGAISIAFISNLLGTMFLSATRQNLCIYIAIRDVLSKIPCIYIEIRDKIKAYFELDNVLPMTNNEINKVLQPMLNPATSAMEGIIDFHFEVMFFLIVIAVLVFYFLFRIVHFSSFNGDGILIKELDDFEKLIYYYPMRHRFHTTTNLFAQLEYGNYLSFLDRPMLFNIENYRIDTAKIPQHQLLETIWTIIPTIILFFIAIPSFALLYAINDLMLPLISLKSDGNQWFWTYEINYFKLLPEEEEVLQQYQENLLLLNNEENIFNE